MISFYGGTRCVYLGRDVIRLLGKPAFVCLLVSDDRTKIALVPCEERHLMSFKVPENMFEKNGRGQMRIHSKQFVESTLIGAGLDKEGTYRVTGIFENKHNAVIFCVSDLQEVAGNRSIIE